MNLNVTARQCAAGNLAMAGLVALSRGWPPSTGFLLLVAVTAVPFLAQLVLARFLPVVAYAVPVLAAEVLMATDAPHADAAPLMLLSLVVVVALFASGAAVVLVLALSVAIVVAADLLTDADGSMMWVVGLSMSTFAGWAIRELERALEELQSAQHQLEQRAATEERRRVAREVHDVVAHTLAVTMLHLTGARLALKDGDADEAAAGLHEAERLGRESLVGLRRTVGLLTRDESVTAAPAPGLGDLPCLVGEYRNGGAVVELQVDVPTAVAEEVGLTAYRIVQESLANAVRHASGARVSVDVRGRDRVLEVRVTDDGSSGALADEPAGGGQGLPGMAERTALLGGTCTAGPRADGPGWEVIATLPLPAGEGAGCPISALVADRSA